MNEPLKKCALKILLFFSDSRLNKIVPWIFWGTFLAAVSLSFFVPIYIDEVGWKILSSRIILEKGQTLGLLPQCRSTFLQTPPFWLLPARYLDALLYGDLSNLLKLRVLGCLSWFVFILLFLVLFNRLLKSQKGNPDMGWFSLGIASVTLFGVLPLQMGLMRPEPGLLICLLGLLLLPTLKNETPTKGWFLKGCFCFLTLLFFSQHPKSLFFFPLIILVALFMSQNLKTKVILVTFTLVVTASALKWSAKATVCPENQLANQIISNVMVNPLLLVTDTKLTSQKLIENFQRFNIYVYHVLFSENYQYEWLPEIRMEPILKRLINFLLRNIIFLWMGSIALQFVFIVRKKKIWWKSYSFCIGVALIMGLVGINFFQSTRHFYESPFIIPLLVLCVGILLTMAKSYPRKIVSCAKFLSLVSILLSSVSVVVLIYYFYPIAKTDWIKGGYLPAQRYSVSAFNRDSMKGRIERLAARCGIRNDPELKHLVVDDYTYSFFGKTKEPFHAHYVMKGWGKDLADKVKFLTEYQSSGLIGSCRFLDEEILPLVERDGELCCAPKFY